MKTNRDFYVYIMASQYNGTLYVGVTNDLKRRAAEHRTETHEGFTKRHQVNLLVYYEYFRDPLSAIAREKQLKAGSRRKKTDLINAFNPRWRDLYDDV